LDTPISIQAGIAHIFLAGLQAYIDDWRSQFLDSKVIITGGDGEHLVKWGLQVDIIDKNLIFWGLWHCCEFQSKALSQ
jgi:type III pantothenate kinase